MSFSHSKRKIPSNIRSLLMLLMVFGMLSLLVPCGVFAQNPIVPVDIKPGGCPNPLNIKSKGVLPVAILGTADFDVEQIDIASIRLLEVAPIRSSLEDVTTPFTDEITSCESCAELGPDGYMDLTLKFSTQDIVQAIGVDNINDGECFILTLTGKLNDGTPIIGEDVVRILKKGKK